jgi:hypothetical protein
VIKNLAGVASPALLLYPARIAANLARVIELAGGTERLRPHIKTHKAGMIVIMHLAQGFTKFKCATIAEGGERRRTVAGRGPRHRLRHAPDRGRAGTEGRQTVSGDCVVTGAAAGRAARV